MTLSIFYLFFQNCPGEPLDCDIYEMSSEDLTRYKKTPGELAEAVNALERDHKFLTAGGVFTDDLIETWISWEFQLLYRRR